MRKFPLALVLAVYILLVISVVPAHAYIDPGSGSMLLQLLLGGVAGIILALKIFWRRILSFFHVKSKDDEETPENNNP